MSLNNINNNVSIPNPLKENALSNQSPKIEKQAEQAQQISQPSQTESINTKDNTKLEKLGTSLNKLDLAPMPDNIKNKFDDFMSKLEKKQDPIGVIEKIRKSNPEDRTSLLLSFQTTMNKMTKEQVKEMRDYLIDTMSSPKNSDDKLLGDLAKAVSKKLDELQDVMIKISKKDYLND